jgi:hypothetical protein
MQQVNMEMAISTAYLAGQLFHVKYVVVFGLSTHLAVHD